ncbi:MAG: T9SS C-terminal target domain-containing protein [Ignavibacteriae bacterium]|nr:MAG: T9SS C-terminal target domain-containing protein [Ignavibacteriota bacterium]
MNFLKSFPFVAVVCLFVNFSSIFSQVPKISSIAVSSGLPYTCDIVPEFLRLDEVSFSGVHKPERTEVTGIPANAFFRVLIVFVQFQNDGGPEIDYWPIGKVPGYMDQVISLTKKYPVNGNWWDTYSAGNEGLSDFWLEQSRGKFHVVGKPYSVVLSHPWNYYVNEGKLPGVMDDVYEKLNALNINWQDYDKWKYTGNLQNKFAFESDGYVDMIFVAFRSRPPQLAFPGGGIAALGPSYTQGNNYIIDSVNNIIINGGFGYNGSGVLMTPGSSGNENDTTYRPNPPLTLWGFKSFSEHEFGHYLFGSGHGNYGKMSGDGAPYGLDECLSPFEAIYLNYIVPKLVNFTTANYNLNDFSSRNSNQYGEVLQVPIGFGNENFLIASRRKISDYDIIMWGDTAKSDPYRIINPEYGKGVYIYHASGILYPSPVDQECADGLFNWAMAGFQHPDWSEEQLIDYYVKTGVAYDNDNTSGFHNNVDGKSIMSWFGIGKKHEYLNADGTDKIYTNKTEVWTSREWQGDRWDAWNVGYNEIFSPYSSPSTRTWTTDRGSSNSGVFIWYDSLIGNTANFKIYKVGENGLTESDILRLTPPSRPMGLKVSFTNCLDNFIFPRVTWLHNQEPDMISNTMPAFMTKKYKIYRAITSETNVIPCDYIYVKTVEFTSITIPEFIDYNVPLSCALTDKTINVRYRISAEDYYFDESVKSDIAQFSLNAQGLKVDEYDFKGNPFKYSLSSNFPNPFNPETNINYTLAVDGQVVIKIYNILGEEVAMLVNEVEKKGLHTVKFNASQLPSGVYFYQLQTAFYNETKRMVLVK